MGLDSELDKDLLGNNNNSLSLILEQKQQSNEEITQLFLGIPKIAESLSMEEFKKKLERIILYVFGLIKKERLDNEYIENFFLTHSTRQLLSSKKTLYMNPCFDFVLVTLETLKRAGFENIQFVIDELQGTGYTKLHFGLQFYYQGKIYHIDYRAQNNVHIDKGPFVSKYEDKGEKTLKPIIIDGEDISLDDNIYSLDGKGLLPLKYFDLKNLELLKKKLARDNTPEEFQRGFLDKVKDPSKPEIFFEFENL